MTYNQSGGEEDMIKQMCKVSALIASLAYPVELLAEYVFTAPPRESVERGVEIYKPVADFLTQATGERFIYRHPQTWSEYSRGMQNKEFDLVFDGPHFVSWRVQNIQHEVILKLPQLMIWRVITGKNNSNIHTLDDLVGRTICAPKSPNFGMLTMMSHFPNPDREPIHVITKGWKDGYNGVVSGKCEAAVLPKTNHKKFDPREEKTRSVHNHLPYPNQAITTGSKISPALKARVVDALLSEDGQKSLSRLRDRFTRGAELVSAESEEYEGISMVLKRADNFLSAAESAQPK